jgi:hypothetical protein
VIGAQRVEARSLTHPRLTTIRYTRDEPDSVPARQPAETRDTDIEYKGHDTGIEVQLVNKYDTSQTCNRCAREDVRATQEGI